MAFSAITRKTYRSAGVRSGNTTEYVSGEPEMAVLINGLVARK
jgi:hypothetical protein